VNPSNGAKAIESRQNSSVSEVLPAFACMDVVLLILLCLLDFLYYPCRRTDGNAVRRYVVCDNRIGPNDAAATDGDIFQYANILTNPDIVLNDDWTFRTDVALGNGVPMSSVVP
jgi:hypothetical protein